MHIFCELKFHLSMLITSMLPNTGLSTLMQKCVYVQYHFICSFRHPVYIAYAVKNIMNCSCKCHYRVGNKTKIGNILKFKSNFYIKWNKI